MLSMPSTHHGKHVSQAREYKSTQARQARKHVSARARKRAKHVNTQSTRARQARDLADSLDISIFLADQHTSFTHKKYTRKNFIKIKKMLRKSPTSNA